MAELQATSFGTLYVIATPIGNIEDITLRALSTLKSVDFILAEDTRHSLPLVQNYNIKKPLHSFHAHNEAEKTESILQALKEGKNAALISDAGTPLIADPGYPLIHAAQLAGITVVPIPGPCAFIAALSAAGIACDSFFFAGFLPAKDNARREALTQYQALKHTVIFYESTHRILKALEAIASLYGQAFKMVLAKELTKIFERIHLDTVENHLCWLKEDPSRCKGEFVLILPPEPEKDNISELDALLTLLLKELSLKQAVKIASLITKIPKNTVYTYALQNDKKSS